MTFRRTAFIIFGLLAAANYFPLLLGLVPFPAHLLAPFPAWGGSSRWPPIPEIGDLITSFYPFHALAARAVHDGSFPLWNPHILSGAPFLANAQSALFYPPNFLYYVLPVPAAWAVCLLIRMFVCAVHDFVCPVDRWNEDWRNCLRHRLFVLRIHDGVAGAGPR